ERERAPDLRAVAVDQLRSEDPGDDHDRCAVGPDLLSRAVVDRREVGDFLALRPAPREHESRAETDAPECLEHVSPPMNAGVEPERFSTLNRDAPALISGHLGNSDPLPLILDP